VLNPSKSEFQWNQPFATSAKSSFFSGHDFTGCGKTPSGGRPGFQPRQQTIDKFLEINPRGEAALKSDSAAPTVGCPIHRFFLAMGGIPRISTSRFVIGHDFTGCGKTPSDGRPGFQPPQKPAASTRALQASEKYIQDCKKRQGTN
jgi:hypothetical protein